MHPKPQQTDAAPPPSEQCYRDSSERRAAMDALARRERYLTALVEMQQRLLAASASENLFERLVAPLGEASGASRVYIFEAHRSPDGNQLFSQRAEWCAPGVKQELHNPALQDMPLERQMPHLYELLSRGQVLSGLVKDFPPEERAVLEPQQHPLLLMLPLWVHGTLAGFIGFDNCAEERAWDKLEVDLLWAAAGAIALAMEQRQSERALRERELRFRRIAENASDVLYRYQLAGTRSFAFISGVVTKSLGFTPEEHYRDPGLWLRAGAPGGPARSRAAAVGRAADGGHARGGALHPARRAPGVAAARGDAGAGRHRAVRGGGGHCPGHHRAPPVRGGPQAVRGQLPPAAGGRAGAGGHPARRAHHLRQLRAGDGPGLRAPA